MKHYKIDPGELNKRITILYTAGKRDAAGYLTDGPMLVPLLKCWAKFSRTSGTEAEKNKADFSETHVRFLIRTPANVHIDRKMVVQYRSDLYEIEYPNDYDDDGQYTELLCIRRTDETEGPDKHEAVDASGVRAVAAASGYSRFGDEVGPEETRDLRAAAQSEGVRRFPYNPPETAPAEEEG